MPDPDGACRRQDLRAHVLAVRRVPRQLDGPGRSTGEAKVDDSTVDVADAREARVRDARAPCVDLDDLVVHEPSGQVELVDAHVDHDPAADLRVGKRERRRLGVELKRLEQHRPPESARCKSGPRARIVCIPATHEPDLEPDVGSIRRGDRCDRVFHRQRDRFFAEDVHPRGRCRLDGLKMAIRRGRYEDGLEPRRPQQLVERAEHGRAAEFSSESPRGEQVHIGDPDEVSIGHAPCDQPRVDRPHPAGPDDANPDPLGHRRTSTFITSREYGRRSGLQAAESQAICHVTNVLSRIRKRGQPHCYGERDGPH